ncbi:hypothetical protein KUTeg_017573 [Tegillarca granosa]|uniref:PDZ domain-containing protein n=1 Tax=Tegillarca granosa TaxID=220873 RepID=A0ABQ9EKR7_TEGGR|nr:hypothetical protein KUTeg_017573 [Tegillarca granosa]
MQLLRNDDIKLETCHNIFTFFKDLKIVKRLLPSGAASRCGKLKVGDRLVSCNGLSLRNLAQAQCLGTLKSEGNNGDLELEILRQMENDVPMEISLTISNGAGFENSKLTLKSPRSERKEIQLSGLDSGSDSDVVLNKYQGNHQVYSEPVSREVTADSNFQLKSSNQKQSDFETDKNFSLKQNNNKMTSISDQDQWEVALPPPQEFSDHNEYSDVSTDNTGEINVPTTNIDDILTDYSPSCSNSSTPIHQPKIAENDSVVNQLEELMHLETNGRYSKHHVLMPLHESVKEQDTIDSESGQEKEDDDKEALDTGNHKKINDVYDSYLYQDKFDKNNSNQTRLIENDNVQIDLNSVVKGDNTFINTNSDIDKTTFDKRENSSNFELRKKDDPSILDNEEIIVPLKSQREQSVFPGLGEKVKSNPIFIEEEVIVPLSIQRENAPKSGTKSRDNVFNERDISPPPTTRSRPKPAPRKKKPLEQQNSVEEVVVPVKTEKESIEQFVERKLGGAVTEDAIIPCQVDRNWDKLKLVVLSKLGEIGKKSDKPSLFDIAKLAQKKKDEADKMALEQSHKKENNIKNDVIDTTKNEDIKNDVTVSTVLDTELSKEMPEIKNPPILQEEMRNLQYSLDKTSNDNVNNEDKNKMFIKDGTSSTLKENEKNLNNEELSRNDSQQENVKDDIVHVTVISHTESSPVSGDSWNKSNYKEDDKQLENQNMNVQNENVCVTVVKTGDPQEREDIQEENCKQILPEHSTNIKIRNDQPGLLHENVDDEAAIQVQTTLPVLTSVDVNVDNKTDQKISQVTISQPKGEPAKMEESVISKVETPKPKDSLGETKYKTSEEPFNIGVLKGILGLGIKVKVTEHGDAEVIEIQSSGPIAKDGNLKSGYVLFMVRHTIIYFYFIPQHEYGHRVGDYLLSINSTELTGLNDNKVQQILRLLPRGLAKIVASATPPSDSTSSPSSTAASPTSPFGSQVSPRLHSSNISPKHKTLSPSEPKSPTRQNQPETSTANTASTKGEEIKAENVKPVKQPPPVAPKPVVSSATDLKKDSTAETANKKHVGGYVSSALGQRKTFFEKKTQPEHPAYTSSLPHKPSSYVSSAERITHEEKSHHKKTEDKGPLDTVIFASMSGRKPDYVTSAGKTSDKADSVSKLEPEPRLIPSGHVDYVSAKPKSPNSPNSPVSPISPREKAEQMASKFITDRKSMVINPQRLNSALSPKQKKDFGASKFAYPAKPSTKQSVIKGEGYVSSSQKSKGKEDNSVVSKTDLSPCTDVSPVTMETDSHKSPVSPDDVKISQVHVDLPSELDKVTDGQSDLQTAKLVMVSNNGPESLHVDRDKKTETTDVNETEVAKKLVDDVISNAVKFIESNSTSDQTSDNKNMPEIELETPVKVGDLNTENSNHLLVPEANTKASIPVESKPLVDSEAYATASASDKSLLADYEPLGEQTNTLDLDQDLSPPDEAPILPSMPPPQLAVPVALNIANAMVVDSFESSDNLYVEEEIEFDPLSPTKLDDPQEVTSNQTDLLIDVSDFSSMSLQNDHKTQNINSASDVNDLTFAENINQENELSVACDVSLESKCMPPSHGAPPLPACDDIVMVTNSVSMSTESSRDKELQEFIESEVVDPFSEQEIQGSTNLLQQQDHTESPDHQNDSESAILDSVENVNENVVNVEVRTNVNHICDSDNSSVNKSQNVDSYKYSDIINIQTSNENSSETPLDVDIDSFPNPALNPLKVKDSGTDTPDTKSLGSLDDLSESEFAMVTSRRRWSLVIGQQELNVLNHSNRSTPLSFDSNVSGRGLISPDQLSALLDKANETMDETGLPEDDEIVVVILNREDSSDSIGLDLDSGPKQQVILIILDQTVTLSIEFEKKDFRFSKKNLNENFTKKSFIQ